MRVLFLSPEPFFQERGTPIAVRLAVQVLSERNTDVVDLLTYNEGREVDIPNVNLHRTPAIPFVKNIGPGISFKKILCDLVFAFTALKMVWQNRHQKYDLVHAVEESVFIALLIRLFFRIPYIYDMDSSLVLQLTEKWYLLKPLRPIFDLFEHVAIQWSLAVVPVCDALAAIADRHGSSETHILRDVSLFELDEPRPVESLRESLGIAPETLLALYIGNLEPYQGIDLVLESVAECRSERIHLVIIGGREDHIELYRDKSKSLGIADRVSFTGPRPVVTLSRYLQQADILVSPRIRGNNTPMKIYSYLHSGKAILATDLPTHTQVLNPTVALLVEPEVESFAAGLDQLVSEDSLRATLGEAAFELAEKYYTYRVFRENLNAIYDHVDAKLTPALSVSAASKAL